MPLTLNATSTEWVTLPEVKSHANVTSSTSDVELEMMWGAAQDAVEALIGPVLWRTVTETVTVHDGVALLRYAPVVSVQTVTYAGTTVTHTLDSDHGMLRGINLRSVDITVAYTAGRTVVRDAIRLATLIIAGHLWETQRGSSAPTPLQDDAFGSQPSGLGYAIPSRALDLLRPHLLPPTVA